MVFCSVVFHLS